MSAFVNCPTCGGMHWGPYGAAGLLLTNPERTRVLLQLRSPFVQHGGTWAFPGGALDAGETPTDAALREAAEEIDLDRSAVAVLGSRVGLSHGAWSYTYVLAEAPETTPVRPVREGLALRWKSLAELPLLNLHPDLRRDWPDLRKVLA